MKNALAFLLVLLLHQSLYAQLPDLIPFHHRNLWEYSDSTKKIIPCKFDNSTPFHCHDSAKGTLNHVSGWIMKNGDFHPLPVIDKLQREKYQRGLSYCWPVKTLFHLFTLIFFKSVRFFISCDRYSGAHEFTSAILMDRDD